MNKELIATIKYLIEQASAAQAKARESGNIYLDWLARGRLMELWTVLAILLGEEEL